ncbi:unnamed protein product, partial [marine sediment metagenome]
MEIKKLNKEDKQGIEGLINMERIGLGIMVYNIQDNIEVMDTTLRDGEQTPGVAFPKEEKLAITKKLFELGVSRVEVASSGVNEGEFDSVKSICEYAK